ncbi:MAG: hypothetical protein LBL84_03345 [Candidatus Nomurabacteria bacterium]|jgi:hypothetical protein|nr:hypothetical protein [Candidatus Nomurabacteria bacterium]
MGNQPAVIINNRKPRNKWKITAIIFIIIALVAACGAVFFLIRSNGLNGELSDAKKKNDANTRVISELNDKLAKSEEDSGTTGEGTNKGYLVVTEWGIKFKIPEGLSDVQYVIADGQLRFGESYAESKGCKISDGSGAYGYILRSTSSKQAANLDDTTGTRGSLLGTQAVGGYYYFYNNPQDSCDGSQKVSDNLSLMKQMIDTLQKV